MESLTAFWSLLRDSNCVTLMYLWVERIALLTMYIYTLYHVRKHQLLVKLVVVNLCCNILRVVVMLALKNKDFERDYIVWRSTLKICLKLCTSRFLSTYHLKSNWKNTSNPSRFFSSWSCWRRLRVQFVLISSPWRL